MTTQTPLQRVTDRLGLFMDFFDHVMPVITLIRRIVSTIEGYRTASNCI